MFTYIEKSFSHERRDNNNQHRFLLLSVLLLILDINGNLERGNIKKKN